MDDKPMSQNLRNLFAVHIVVAAVLGLPLWLVPGRFMLLVGWIPEMRELSPELSLPGTMFFNSTQARLLGAALVAIAYSSYQGWRAGGWRDVAILVKMELVFCVLGAVAILYNAFRFNFGLSIFVWLTFAILVLFAVAWALVWRGQSQS